MRLMPLVRAVTMPLGGNDEREQTLNQLLAEMDGFDTNKGSACCWRRPTVRRYWIRPCCDRGGLTGELSSIRPDLKGRIDVP